jgi:hypothetical protein
MISAQRKISFGVVLALLALVVASPARADDTPTLVTDPASHCSVGTFYPQAGLVPHWSGACVGGKADGPGIVEWQLNGTFNGRNEGTFHAGLLEGRGIKATADGRRYEAEFRNGKMNGRCVMTTPAVRLDGQCANDQFNGPGVAVFTDGNRYEGNFKDSEFTGQGVFSEKNGSRLEGEWIHNHLTGKGRGVYPGIGRYEGDFVNGDFEGTGTYYFDEDANVYEGEWHKGLPNGRGVLHGTTHGLLGSGRHDYDGTWVNGCFHQEPYTAEVMTTRAACGFN